MKGGSLGAPELKIHDYFNLAFLSILVVANCIYLALATEVSNVGTENLGDQHNYLSNIILISFVLYLLVDIIWVILIPKCVASNPQAILIHHCACLLMVAIPFIERQFSWHLSVCLLVEINTLFLTLRRNLPLNTLPQTICNIAFYASWVLLRLIMMPLLVAFFYSEYIRYSQYLNEYHNIAGYGVGGMAFVTALSYKWTLDMVLKLGSAGSKKE